MLNFNFYAPTNFHFGRGVELKAGEMIASMGGKKALIHYGGGSAVKSGLIARVAASLDAAGIAHVELGGVQLYLKAGDSWNVTVENTKKYRAYAEAGGRSSKQRRIAAH